jgi:transcriptional regulator with XRE-family HTH domain
MPTVERTRHGVTQAKEFGKRVRDFRVALGISQEAGLHRTYVGHCERGEVNVSLYNIVRLAAALQVDPADLVRGLRP